MSKLKQAMKNIALAWWMIIVITIGVLDARYGWQGMTKFFSWSWPLSWMIIAAIVVTILAMILPVQRGKKK
ncbi:MAG: hypothetical protein LKG31_00860 [Lactobacillus sp.]|jgi:hypothetical protein|nr:hypothetical protein [Lactobacillus sp.]